MSLSRRDLLRTAPVAVAAGLHPRVGAPARAEPLIVRMHEPRNLETPLSELFSPDVDKFFVRSHFALPASDPKRRSGGGVTVEGHVENKLQLTLDDLKKMKPETVSREILLECAGNGRVFLTPQARGLQWGPARSGRPSGPAFRWVRCSNAQR
jgi:DMSO/TMAO reductase YedYZ molybdopterin-dependent catalytic subunit